MAQQDKDASVFAQIEHLVAEEHRLFEGELGGDPAQAHARPAGVVKKYTG